MATDPRGWQADVRAPVLGLPARSTLLFSEVILWIARLIVVWHIIFKIKKKKKPKYTKEE